ncbi:MAG: phosphotransferase family protein, partial [Acidobacteriota bacterium]
APFYVMERRRGVILRRQPPAGLHLSPPVMARLSERFIDHLAALHTVDVDAAGLGDLGKPEGYVERQVGGWIRRYEKAQTDTWPELDETAAWLTTHQPQDSGAGLIHNDYKFDNVILDANDLTQVVAVLDWEMCTLGDPLMDLGTTLAYWVEADDPAPFRAAAFGPTALPGAWTRRQLAEHYAEITGADLSKLVFYVAFGHYKLAVIVQQIYWRYANGHTQDPRFAQLDQMVGLLGKVALGNVSRGRF